jgi:hypothetical protein
MNRRPGPAPAAAGLGLEPSKPESLARTAAGHRDRTRACRLGQAAPRHSIFLSTADSVPRVGGYGVFGRRITREL